MANRVTQNQHSSARQKPGVPIPDDENLLETQGSPAGEDLQDGELSAAPEPAEPEDEDAEDDDDAEDDADDDLDDEEEDGSGGHV